MDISPEKLQQMKLSSEQRKEQLIADLNGTIGEIRVLDALIAESQQPPENPDLN